MQGKNWGKKIVQLNLFNLFQIISLFPNELNTNELISWCLL
jgi:hypothetical protein